MDHDDIRMAADYVECIHSRDAKAEYERWGLSASAIEELLQEKFLKPISLIDGTLTEEYMQRELSNATFREIWNYRRK